MEQQLKDNIIEYARKVVQYPKGSSGFDPVDLINLERAITKLDQFKLNSL